MPTNPPKAPATHTQALDNDNLRTGDLAMEFLFHMHADEGASRRDAMEALFHHLMTILSDGRQYAIRMLPAVYDTAYQDGALARRITLRWSVQLVNPSEAEIGEEIIKAAFAAFMQDESPMQFALEGDVYRRIR